MRLAHIVGVFVLGIVLVAGQSPVAAQKGQKRAQKKAAAAAKKQQDQVLAYSLQQTAHLLTKADRDYKGHRAAAVKHIKHAITHLKKEAHLRGFKVMNDYQGKEPQPVSDAQLKQAAGNLTTIQKQLNGLPTSMHRGKAAEQIGKAISELNTALTIK
jgi:hypothetical protein